MADEEDGPAKRKRTRKRKRSEKEPVSKVPSISSADDGWQKQGKKKIVVKIPEYDSSRFPDFEEIRISNVGQRIYPKTVENFDDWLREQREKCCRPIENLSQITFYYPPEPQRREIVADLRAFFPVSLNENQLLLRFQKIIRQKANPEYFCHRDDSLWTIGLDKVAPAQVDSVRQRFLCLLGASSEQIQNVLWRCLVFQSPQESNHLVLWRLVVHDDFYRQFDEQNKLLDEVAFKWQWRHYSFPQN